MSKPHDMKNSEPGLVWRLGRKLFVKLYPPSNPRYLDRSMLDFISTLPSEAKVLNLGSGTSQLSANSINLDIRPYLNVDIVGDGHKLPFKNNSLDCVVCSAVLEHTAYPQKVAQEIIRVLKPRGIAVVQVPFLEQIHFPKSRLWHDYYRYTLDGLRMLFAEMNEIKSGVSAGPSQVLADIFREYPALVFEGTFLYYPVQLILSWLTLPLRWLDFLVKKKPSMSHWARAFYFIGQKPSI